jgi:hypothetical protein
MANVAARPYAWTRVRSRLRWGFPRNREVGVLREEANVTSGTQQVSRCEKGLLPRPDPGNAPGGPKTAFSKRSGDIPKIFYFGFLVS